MSLTNKSVNEFTELLAAKESVPGGGGASALVASIGIALGTMVGQFTVGKKKYADVEEDIIQLMDQAEVLRKTGLCYKKLGSYETARNCLADANSVKPETAAIIAELADCYALCAEERHAKVLFREAFYVDPQKIDPAFLDSELINCLMRNVQDRGYSGAALMEWIPVYGQLYGVFTVKRKLRPTEIARLKQEIYAKENEIKDPSCQTELLTPRLINLYFWLVDYYLSTNEDVSKVNEIVTRIKILDTEIYELYVK